MRFIGEFIYCDHFTIIGNYDLTKAFGMNPHSKLVMASKSYVQLVIAIRISQIQGYFKTRIFQYKDISRFFWPFNFFFLHI